MTRLCLALLLVATLAVNAIAQDEPPPPPPPLEEDVVLPEEPELEETTTSAPEEVKPECRADIAGEKGLFATPNFPEEYPQKSNCTWNILAPEGKRVKLIFHLVMVEDHNNCIFDGVKVYETAGDSNTTLIRHFCGYLDNELVITSTTNQVSVQFYSDSAVETSGFLASYRTIDVEEEEQVDHSLDENFLLTFPQGLSTQDSDSPKDKICLQLFNVQQPGQATVKVYSSENILNDTAALVETMEFPDPLTDANSCIEVQVPEGFEKAVAVVGVDGVFGDYVFKSYGLVRIVKSSTLAMIQTDMFDYKPSQEVRIRALVLDATLKPSQKIQEFTEVFVKDPADNRIAQWRGVQLNKGMTRGQQLSMKLDKEPTLGRYKITAKNGDETVAEAEFKVSERVLPRFEVKLEEPAELIVNSTEKEFKVCAFYTHGGKVKGRAVAVFETVTQPQYWRAKPKTTLIAKDEVELNNGCATFLLDTEELAKLYKGGRELKALATVTEDGTGTQASDSVAKNFEKTPYKITHQGSSEEHTVLAQGGFPYVGQIQAIKHDGVTKMANTRLEVCFKLFTDISTFKNNWYEITGNVWQMNEDDIFEAGQKLLTIKLEDVCQEHMTDENGMVHFSVNLDHISANASKLSIQTKALDDLETGIEQPSNKLDVRLIHTNASSAATIKTIEGQTQKMKCGENNKVDVFFTSKMSSKVHIIWYMTSGGSIVKQGSQELDAGVEDSSNDYIGDVKKIKFNQAEDASEVTINRYSFNVNFDSQEMLDGRNDMSKLVKLMVYITEANSTSIARKDFDFVACEATQKLQWNKEKALPRDQVKLEIVGGPKEGGICGYSVVDKSVELISNPNKVTASKLQQLKEDLSENKIISDRLPEKCKKAQSIQNSLKELGLVGLTDLASGADDCTVTDVTNKTLQRESEDEIAYDYEDGPVPLSGAAAPQAIAFEAAAPLAASGAPAPPQVLRQKVGAEADSANRLTPLKPVEAPKVDLRNYFPETWLFDIVDLDEEGSTVLDLNVPDTITTWVADAYCLSPRQGAVVSESANLLVTQDFFADLVLPYSVKRGEIFPLNVSVSSSVDLQLPLQITVQNSDDFKIGEAVASVCLAPQDNQIQSFTVKAKELNEVNVTVEAKIKSADGCQLDDANAEGFRDALVKPIIVKPEGFPLEKTQSEFICMQPGEEPKNVPLEPLVLPGDDDLVEGSVRAWVSVTGDIMAPALANLDKLVTTPYGCGEQNMVSVVPNIYLLEYLEGKGVSVPDIERRAKANIVKGWKRQQKYRHRDGSYSVWGPSDEGAEGSMWLTSFVVKSFGTAAKYFTDSELKSFQTRMKQSIKWMTSNVDEETGCAKNVGYTIHSELKGPSLTAAMATAILSQDDVKVIGSRQAYINTSKLYKGIACAMNRTEEGDVYSKALITYTAYLLDEKIAQGPPPPTEEGAKEVSVAKSTAKSLMDDLVPKANTTLDGKLFWSTGKNNKARDVELTAYMVLNLVKQNKLSEALMAIKWLTTHRNSRGGFVSTQDTMVALQAISEYSKQIRKDEVDLTVEAETESGQEAWSETFNIDPTNQLLFTRESVPVGGQTTNAKVKVSGNGCAMVQTLLRYNVKKSPYEKVFDLSAETDGEVLRLCGSYDGGKDATDMVVIEAELLSGYEADEASLKDLVNNKEAAAPVKKYEYNSKDSVVVLYFNDMPKTQSCWEVATKQNNQIGDLQPANVKIYDYYDPKETYSVNYGLSSLQEE